MIAILIYPKDVTRIIDIPKGISTIGSVQDFLLNFEDVGVGDQAIIKNKFYEYTESGWEQISNTAAEMKQTQYKKEGLGAFLNQSQN